MCFRKLFRRKHTVCNCGCHHTEEDCAERRKRIVADPKKEYINLEPAVTPEVINKAEEEKKLTKAQLEKLTRAELLALCKERGITGVSRLTKAELVKKLK